MLSSCARREPTPTARFASEAPVDAVRSVVKGRQFDEIIVSTLPTGASRWLGIDLPRRLERLTSVSVRHVVAQPQVEVRWERPPEREDLGVLSPLAPMFKRR